MKKQLYSILMAATAMLFSLSGKAQTVATFDDLSLSSNSSWDGSSHPLGTTFSDGHAIFSNFYDTSYGGFWATGWAYSNMQDSTTAGYTNQFSSRAASGYNSANYAVGQQDAIIVLDSNAAGKVVDGMYIDNGTYAALSMKYGDGFEKRFGDTTGTGCGCPQGSYPDWFKLTVRNWYNGTMGTDSVTFYLADYRFSDTTQNYIVSNWTWVDLTSLGNTDSLLFHLSSSQNNPYGMNTPGFFCMDNFTTANSPAGIQGLSKDDAMVDVYPNPVVSNVSINLSKAEDRNLALKITDITGRIIYAKSVISPGIVMVDMSDYSAGTYFITVIGSNTLINKKIVKE